MMADLYVFDDGTVIDVSAVDGEFSIVPVAGIQGPAGAVGPPGVAGVAGSSGNAGAAATVAVGSVNTGPVGSQAFVTNTGTSSAAVLNFTLPGGVAGATGAQGVSGSSGAQGVQGERGLQGISGSVGPAGEVGPAGSGAPGPQGIAGERGIQGLVGERGLQGIQGERGVVGERGIQGEIGLTGNVGATGSVGAAGVSLDIQGAVATYSALPSNAQPGDAWIVQSDGKLYYRDATGFPSAGQGVPFQGPQGVIGIQGERGLTGDTGASGAAGPVGATGIAGERGLQGLVGERGLQGIPGEIGSSGVAGAAGSVGPQGIQGIQGQTGSTGRGFIWRGEFSSSTYAVDDVVAYYGSSFVCLTAGTTQSPTVSPASWSMLASKGDAGINGAQGIQGVQGLQGDVGAASVVAGPTGLTGATGATGPAGPTEWSGLTGVPTDIVYASATQTLTSKRITERVNTVASSATPAINTDTTDVFTITALAANITSMSSGLTGSPTDGQKLLIRIKGAAAQTISWGAIFSSSGVATLLATTAASKTHMVGLIFDSAAAKWVCVAVDAAGY